ncbi:MAG: hypothetical protein IPH31_03660 [Lewinellaceae bacterium]|nr:hypothetical protein [Lewinellaceae bacterium]
MENHQILDQLGEAPVRTPEQEKEVYSLRFNASVSLSRIRNAQYALLALGLFTIIAGLVSSKDHTLEFSIVLGVYYWCCGLITLKFPVVGISMALAVFTILVVLSMAENILNLFSGIFIKVGAYYFLIHGFGGGQELKKTLKDAFDLGISEQELREPI